MNDLIKLFSPYNILNNLLTGVIFIYFFKCIIAVNIELQNNIIENIFIYYFFGSVFSRLGSIIIEPICKKLKIVKYEPYERFLKAEKLDQKINILVESNNFYRTNIAIFIFIILLKPLYWLAYSLAYKPEKWSSTETLFYCIAILICILYLLSFRKQTENIVNRIRSAIDHS